MAFEGWKRSAGLRFFLVFSIAATAIAVRRWPQIVSPDVWVEDGTQVIPAFAKMGWAALFVPVNGYLITPAKVISYVGLSLSFERYALVSTLLAIGAQAAVVATIAAAPTLLAAPVLAALLIPFLPIGSEVYALPLYTFWWTTLLLFVGLFWRDGERFGLRALMIVIGSLSSPFIVVAWPLFALRAALDRTRGSVVALALAVALAAVQGTLMLETHAAGVPPLDALRHMPTLVGKYFGTALYGSGHHGSFAFGSAVIAFLSASVLGLPKEKRGVYAMLGFCLAAAVLTSVSRVSVDAPHPLLAGPRYFFFPLTLTGWMLLFLAAEARRTVGLAAMAIAGAYVPTFGPAFTFEPQVAKEPWADQAKACILAPDDYTFDIQYGLPQIQWSSTMKGADCRKLARRALF